MTTETRSPSVEPVTVSGYYENRDGTVTYYFWQNGQVQAGNTHQGWEDVPSDELPY